MECISPWSNIWFDHHTSLCQKPCPHACVFDAEADEDQGIAEDVENKENKDALPKREARGSTCGVPCVSKTAWASPMIKKFIDAQNGKEKYSCLH